MALGWIQACGMITSFVSLTYCTFEYNLNINWKDKFSTGVKAMPLYAICVLYKCLSICTMIALLRFYALIPIFTMYIMLVLVVYLVSGSIKSTGLTPRFTPGIRFTPYLALFTMPIFHSERSTERDLVDAPDSVYLKWFQWEAFVSFLLHTIILGSLALLWQFDITSVRNNYPGAMVWPWEEELYDCADPTIKLHVPLICLIIITFGFLHFLCTTFYVHRYPHVWNLRRSTEDNTVDEMENKNTQQQRRITQNQFVIEDVLPHLTDFEKYRAQCGEARDATFQDRLVLSPVRKF